MKLFTAALLATAALLVLAAKAFDVIDITGSVNGTSQCAEDGELCKALESLMNNELNDPDRSKRWKVAIANILADDWDHMLRNMKNQAESIEIY